MDKMSITSVRYVDFSGSVVGIVAVIDGVTMSVPLDPANRHYAEIMRQVDAGELVIAAAST